MPKYLIINDKKQPLAAIKATSPHEAMDKAADKGLLHQEKLDRFENITAIEIPPTAD